MSETFVILGGGLAAWSAASTLRERGFEGRVVLIAAEPELPYDRPPLSKAHLAGTASSEEVRLSPDSWYAEQGIETLLGVAARHVDASNSVVHLEDGRELAYDALLVATGSEPRRLRAPGGDLDGVRYLRTLSDAEAIRDELQPGARLCVVGAGFIGLEVAASARARGVDVTVVEALETPLEAHLGRAMGEVVAGISRDAGVHLRTGCTVESFEGVDRVTAVRTAAGDAIPCDTVVVGIGVSPALGPLARSGIRMSDGVLVDACCATSASGVFAAGDVARQRHPLFGSLRIEHWQNALDQGAAAAGSMLGDAEPYANVPWFWSDQHGRNLQFAGVAAGSDDLVIRGEWSSRRFVGFYLRAGSVTGAFGVDAGRDVRRSMRLIEAGGRVSSAALADPSVDLRDLVEAHTSSAAGAAP